MQGAETSKIMLPCERRVHLHKSASFKTIFEKDLTNRQKNNVEIDLENIKSPFNKHKKRMRGNIKKYYPKYAKLSDCGSHFGAICLSS